MPAAWLHGGGAASLGAVLLLASAPVPAALAAERNINTRAAPQNASDALRTSNFNASQATSNEAHSDAAGRARSEITPGSNAHRPDEQGNPASERLVRQLLRLRRSAPRHETPATFVGGVLLPLLGIAYVSYLFASRCLPRSRTAGLQAAAVAVSDSAAASYARRAVAIASPHATRVCVSLYFLHEGGQELQLKWAQLSESFVPVMTPFGWMRLVPPWEKGDAVDIVLFATAVCTAVNLIPDTGLVLLLVDVATDVIDLLGQHAIAALAGQQQPINELTAKKVALLGVMILTVYTRRVLVAARAHAAAHSLPHSLPHSLTQPDAHGGSGGGGRGGEKGGGGSAQRVLRGEKLSAAALLAGRLLIASLFVHVGNFELHRLNGAEPSFDIDPNDPHNVLWPKLVQLALAVPLVMGLRTKAVSQLLIVTLAHSARSYIVAFSERYAQTQGDLRAFRTLFALSIAARGNASPRIESISLAFFATAWSHSVLEAASVWQFWRYERLQTRLHVREHFSVNVAVAGGLMLIREMGGGRYTFDELLKKAK